MKDFMFIFRGATEQYDFSAEEMQQHMQKWFAWVDDLKAKNIYKAGEPLLPEGKMVKGAKALVTDGPFAESKELVGGFFIIKAASLEEATEIAKGCPDLPLDGSVEVREVMKMDM
ncbi:YciI family protein [Longitalea luteola]|uniref:YciI family protein n=1 Tax=Longitalea luteola TaxID=2812563 RepID=UPI001A969D32|nr:YciI family protein [Longitalea luteola]